MVEKKPSDTEREVSKKLTEALSRIGFNVQFSDTNQEFVNPDFIAKKRVSGSEYKIAIELKDKSNINNAINRGIKMLEKINKVEKFDKLLLLFLNRNNLNIKNDSSHVFLRENPTNFEIINLDDLDRWTQNLSNFFSPKEQNEVFYQVKLLSKKLIELVAKTPENLESLEWRDLERMISELFEGIGFKTTLTPSSKDGGKDVILECTIDDTQKSYIK